MIAKIGSLFAGIGGIEQGFLNAKDFEIMWANEIDCVVTSSYKFLI